MRCISPGLAYHGRTVSQPNPFPPPSLMTIPPPENEAALLTRAHALAGQTLAQAAARMRVPVPADLRRAKGWTGELLERMLGTTAKTLPEPDFTKLGIELKTLPLRRDGLPKESTYVCTVPMTDHIGLTWENSVVYRKLRRVLWVPVEGEPDIPVPERRIGTALLWSPTPDEEAVLRTDFEELMELVCLGRLGEITARLGTWLQIRPKAAHGRALGHGIGADGETIFTLPLGFYLRASFTARLLQQHFAMPTPE
jgi:DNA mismatch repair protein MutH